MADRFEKTTRICRICEIEYPLTSDNFHKDSHDPRGFQSACKGCRKQEASAIENARAKNVVGKLDDEIMRTITATRYAPSAGCPSPKEMLEHILRAFGGAEMFAMHFAAQFAASKPGSTVREKMLRQVLALSAVVHKSGDSDASTEEMTDDELAVRLQQSALRIAGKTA